MLLVVGSKALGIQKMAMAGWESVVSTQAMKRSDA
jgi:hypothetical protein